MTFKYSFTFPISGPNKLPRFKSWAAENASELEISLPPEIPAKSKAMTTRLKSVEDRQWLTSKLAGVTL